MPLYEYKCASCRLIFEDRQEIKNADKEGSCPRCKAASPRHYGHMAFSFAGGAPTKDSVDQAVGRASEKKWEEVNRKLAQRQKVRAESKENFLMSADRDTFRASTPEEKETVRTTINAYEKSVQAGGL